MFINDDNNRDNRNYPIEERDYLYERETPNVHKYHWITCTHSETWFITYERNASHTVTGYLLYLIFQRKRFVDSYYFWKKHQRVEICVLLYIGKLRYALVSPWPVHKNKVLSHYKLLARNSHSATLRNTPRNRSCILRLLKFRDYKRDRPIPSNYTTPRSIDESD